MKALITGGNSGIGYAIVNSFLRKGYYVDVIDQSISLLQSEQHSHLRAYEFDLSNLEKIAGFINQISSGYDVVVNSAGIREIQYTLDLSLEEWKKVIDVNLSAAFMVSQQVAKIAVCQNRATNIINIASISGLQAEPNRSAYCSSKHGIIGLTKAMAMDLGKHGIRINAIAPGVIRTELTESYFSNSEVIGLIEKNSPLRRYGQTQHVISAIEFILNNDFVTGSVVVVDGGWLAGKEL